MIKGLHASAVRCLVVLAAGMGLPFPGALSAQTVADGIHPYLEYQKRVKAAESLSALDTGLFGEGVSLYDGSTQFRVVEIDLPGNSELPVQLSRRLNVQLQPQGTIRDHDARLLGLGNWDIDVPYVTATYASSSGLPAQICTVGSVPGGGVFSVREFWSGLNVHLPGRGDTAMLSIVSGTPLPTGGASTRLTTKERDAIDCISMNGGSREGFRLTTSSGEKYYFNQLTTRREAPLQKGVPRTDGSPPISMMLERTRYYMLATRIEDRFGNSVQFTYNANGHPTRIWANDGREITFTYDQQRMAGASVNGRSWAFQYNDGQVEKQLIRVVRPDSSTWSYSYSDTLLPAAPANIDSLPLAPWCRSAQLPLSASYVIVATHPAGAVGTFSFSNRRHWRQGVHQTECNRKGVDRENPEYVLEVPNYFDVLSITDKSIAGPGLDTMRWSYDFGGTPSTFWGTETESPVYPCTTCTRTKVVHVGRPDGTTQRLTFGNLYMFNDGQELGEQLLDAQGQVVQSRTNEYLAENAVAGQPFIGVFGSILGGLSDPATARIRPLTQMLLQQDGTDYLWRVTAFDRFARPTERVRTGPSGSVRERLDYHDNTDLWVLGQLAKLTDLGSGRVVAEAAFDAKAMPAETYAFGRRTQTRTYQPDGTIGALSDPNGKTTTLSGWKRGIPALVQYPDSTSSRVSIDDNGWILSSTDENGFTTSYGYDALGRVSSVSYPVGDSVAWAPIGRSFVQIGQVEYGVGAGHWRQITTIGGGRAETYYDALWRPLITREYDVSDIQGTQRFQRFAYDHDGKQLFASYPGSKHDLVTGNWSEYDALGRRTAAVQDSELGAIVALTEYLPGSRTRVTDARGKQTTTSFQSYDKPQFEAPITIAKPEGVVLDIARDVFGKPTSVTQRSADGAVSLTRRYVYDANQRLCKTVEPETGATVVGYDAADNVLWSAAGTSLLNATNCDSAAAYASGRRVDRTYDARNRLKSLAFPDGNGNQDWTYTADGLPQQVSTQNGISLGPVVNTYVYNRRRLLIGENVAVTGVFDWAMGYGYDTRGAAASVQYPSGLSVAMAPNGLGQPTRAGGFALGVSYYPGGGMRQFTYGNGIVHSMTQNARQLPARSTDSGGAMDNSYSYDANGNVTVIGDALSSVRKRSMQYDDLDRLTQAASMAFGGDGVMRYSYDALDNMRSARLAGVKDHGYWYDASNRLTNVQSATGSTIMGLSYDAQGNLASRNGQIFRFDFGNRLREVVGSEEYAYDANGRRVLSKAAGGDVISMYDSAGVLRRQESQRTGEGTEYIHLNGSLLAKSTTSVAPGVPVVSVPSFSSNGTFQVSWSSVAGVSAYELQQRAGQGEWAAAYRGAAKTWTATGKAAGSYQLRARACRSSLCGGWSAVATVVVELPPAQAPVLTAPSTASGGNYVVSWSAVAGATTYRLDEQRGDGEWVQIQDSAERTRSFSAMPPGVYRYGVRACNNSGCGSYSSRIPVQSVHLPTSAPALAAPSKSLGSSYSISWSAVANSTSYQLDERSSGGSWATIANGSSTTQAVSGRAQGTYEYRVRGCASVGCGPYSAVASVQVVVAPSAVPSISAPESSGTGSYAVSWSTSGRATSYQLQERINSGGFAVIQNSGLLQRSFGGKVDGTYGYRVAACNEAGCSGFSATASVVVNLPPPVPAAPQLINAMYFYSGGNTTYQGGWTAVAGATRYEFSGGAGCVTTRLLCSVTVRGAPKVVPSTVRACNDVGCSVPSNAVIPDNGLE
ncbi:RHS repeat protein [Stenotrophomonas sp. PFBMAA-4]|uniref:RHS repeat protein n=1 Tax=Stenotrophomonas sp. PFBMAA-4 TaxID=3043301 RepID=UPI0024B5DAED|nr:RHS repeat protein [Stenotrophomonas sp. PFBMAA-4]MDI9273147.1 RHS repeat protein [Stenotrophomonas sp. PFBMAA-4]